MATTTTTLPAAAAPSHLRPKRSTRTPRTARDSNAVRASVLDVAMQLGFGDPNSTVASWMFNPLAEADEEGEEAEAQEKEEVVVEEEGYEVRFAST